MLAIQIILGFCLTIVSIVIQVVFVEIIIRRLERIFSGKDQTQPGFSSFVITLSSISFWLLISLSLVVCMWSFVLMGLGIFASLEESVYFSLVAFTTLGFGDVTLPIDWRILSGFIAANGFILFGLYTAVLIEAMARLRGDR